MGRAGHFNQGHAVVLVVEGQTLVNIVIGIFAVGGRKIEHRKTNLAAHAGAANFLGNGLMEEIHVGKAGSARANHIGHSDLGAIAHKLFTDMKLLGGPYMFL